jgi:hypothetical protein
MAITLSEPDRIFRNSLIDNLRDLLGEMDLRASVQRRHRSSAGEHRGPAWRHPAHWQ